MSLQEKFILDATAGFRMMWFDKHHPNCIYLDQRPECEPDIVGDFRDLKQFPDETFKLIVFDPPHLVFEGGKRLSNMQQEFGELNPETWQSDIKNGFLELWRILKPRGVLIFKWSNQCYSCADVMKTFPSAPLFYQVSTANKSASSKTLWFCFMKIPEAKTT